LLAAVVGEKDIDARLAAMQTLDLIRQRRIDFMFKHALVRDALYQSLLSEARTALALIVIE
jgi:predicted ATPase